MKTTNWGLVQTGCLGGLFVIVNLSVRSGRPIDASHGRNVWLFRAVTCGICVLGAVYAEVMMRRQNAAAVPVDFSVPSLPPRTRAISVTYRNTLDAARRNELYTLLNRNVFLLLFNLLATAAAGLAAGQIAPFSVTAAAIAFPVLHLFAFGTLLAYLGLLVSGMLRTKFPTPDSVRVCTTSLTAEGFHDVTPDKVIPYEWAQVRQILESAGDVHVWTLTSGCYIPRSAFASLDEARRYHRAAVTLWRSRGAVWPDDVPDVIDKTRNLPAGVVPPQPAGDENPYAAPLVPPHDGGDEASGPSAYAKVIRWAAVIAAAESLAVAAWVLLS